MPSALVNGVRRALTQRARTAPVRSFNTSAPKRGGDGEPVRAHPPHQSTCLPLGRYLGFPRSLPLTSPPSLPQAYIHAEKMYDVGAVRTP